MEMPPVSNVTPFPRNAIGWALAPVLGPWFQRMITSRAGRALPCATPSSAPKPSSCIFLSSSTSTLTPSLVSLCASLARLSG